MEENGLPASGDGEEACSAVVLLSSAYDFPFCFPFVSVMMKVTAFCFGSSFSDLQEAIKKTVTLTLVFWVFCLRLSLFFSVCSLFFCFSGFPFFCSLIFSPHILASATARSLSKSLFNILAVSLGESSFSDPSKSHLRPDPPPSSFLDNCPPLSSLCLF
ncbi:hypothetical protein BDE02_08G200600 [Populus trichocarpa]|nr:hypothetical protein BDE02_08G200600 [Populus trichocarpa]